MPTFENIMDTVKSMYQIFTFDGKLILNMDASPKDDKTTTEDMKNPIEILEDTQK